MPLLEIDGLEAGYGPIRALFGISLALDEGETLALIGANGAGKTTLLRTMCGLITPTGGEIRYDGDSLAGRPAHAVAALGLAMVPEGRRLFPSLTVEDNILMGACAGRRGPWTLGCVDIRGSHGLENLIQTPFPEGGLSEPGSPDSEGSPVGTDGTALARQAQ